MKNRLVYSTFLELRTEQLIEIPIDKNIPEGYIPSLEFQGGLKTPSVLVQVRNGKALTTTVNPTEQKIILQAEGTYRN